MTTTVLVSVAASVLVSLLVVTVLVLLLRRSPARPQARNGRHDELEQVLADLNSRMDAMSLEVSEALARTQEESRRTRVLGELGSTIDLDEVLSRTVDAAGSLRGVDAAMVKLTGSDEEPTAATGITPDEIEEYAVGEVPAGRRIRWIHLDYRAGEATPSEGTVRPILAGLAVPIHGELDTIGLLTVFSRTSRQGLEPDVVAEAEALALRAGPAIENARRFREARHQADLDALTGLHNRRYFHETLARETARAQRYNRRLALIVLDLDDFKAINDRIGHLAGDTVLAEVADRVRDVVRQSDVACRVGGDELAVILPESTLADAEQLYRRIQTAVSSRPISHAGRLLLSAGIAELRTQDDPFALFQRADEALYRAKQAGKGRVASETAGIGVTPLPLPHESQSTAFGRDS
jgi:diguanylate cyclase (GGDEF)-like protein